MFTLGSFVDGKAGEGEDLAPWPPGKQRYHYQRSGRERLSHRAGVLASSGRLLDLLLLPPYKPDLDFSPSRLHLWALEQLTGLGGHKAINGAFDS
jgi:hypothetical protein